jgi:hypothetical protein
VTSKKLVPFLVFNPPGCRANPGGFLFILVLKKRKRGGNDMSTQVVTPTPRTAKPTVAGVFDIIVGSMCILGVLALVVLGFVVTVDAGDWVFNPAFIFWLAAIPVAALGVVSIVGGVFCLQRKQWGWALAGSITATCVSPHVLGIVAVVLTAVSRDEFKR